MRYTIFTPTYNRAHLLPALYQSLKEQNFRDMEWLIVDDGSTDITEFEVEQFVTESSFAIRYIKQLNGGKHRAFNRGIAEARGEWFICVDSDDPLTPEAIKNMNDVIARIPEKCGGFAGLFIHKNKTLLGCTFTEEMIADTIDIRDVHHRYEDHPEVYRTSILKQYRFPEFDGEKFLTEAELFDRMSMQHPLLYTNLPMQYKEYLDGGLTSRMLRIRIESINGTLLYYKERYQNSKKWKYKIRALLNYARFLCHAFARKSVLVNPIMMKGFICMPIAYIIYLKDCRTYKKKSKVMSRNAYIYMRK